MLNPNCSQSGNVGNYVGTIFLALDEVCVSIVVFPWSGKYLDLIYLGFSLDTQDLLHPSLSALLQSNILADSTIRSSLRSGSKIASELSLKAAPVQRVLQQSRPDRE